MTSNNESQQAKQERLIEQKSVEHDLEICEDEVVRAKGQLATASKDDVEFWQIQIAFCEGSVVRNKQKLADIDRELADCQ